MMMKLIWKTALLIVGAGAVLCAQEAAPASPTFKSQEEMDGFQAIQSALDPASRIQAVEEFAAQYPESEFKGVAFQIAALTAHSIGDSEKVLIYGDRCLEADPDNFVVMVILAGVIAQSTREFDLDKGEKLKRVTDLSNRALELVDVAVKPNPNVTDEQWEGGKADVRAQAHEALGLAAMVNKDYAKAADEFEQAIDVGITPNPASDIRLASAYVQLKRYDEAISALDKVLGDAQLHPQIRQIAESERARAVKLKDAAAK